MNLSVVIITYNEEHNIERCLRAVDAIADEIIVVDSGSTDQTENICRKYDKCKFYTHPFENYGKQKKYAVSLSAHNWVLAIDADEVVSPQLQAEIKMLFATGVVDEYAGFYVSVPLVFMNKIFSYGYEVNHLHLRLFNKHCGGFDIADIHEKATVKGKTKALKKPLYHYSYRDTTHYFQKFNPYTSLSAKYIVEKKKKITKAKILLKFNAAFFTNYFLRKNFMNGFPGLLWSLNVAYYTLTKYVKAFEIQQK